MWRIYQYRMKSHLMDFGNLFWTMIFPIILSSFFSLAFSNIASSEYFNTIPVAVVVESESVYSDNFLDTLSSVQMDDQKLFEAHTFESVSKAEEAMHNEEVDVLFIYDEALEIRVKKEGMNQTVAKHFADQYTQTESMFAHLAETNPQSLSVLANFEFDASDYISDQNQQRGNVDPMLGYYYALIAMACLFGSFLGLKETSFVEANQSSTGARIQVSPAKKSKIYVGGLLAATTIQVFSISLLLLFITFVLKIDMGNRAPALALATIVGAAAGVALGAFVALISKKNYDVKNSMLTGVSMIMSFFAGLMVHSVKYQIYKNAPVLSYINPANLIADAFYALYYYPDYRRYWINIAILVGLIVAMYAVVIFLARRRSYESI
ncbi:MAG: ABC transporter permease [Clostridiaceae bacterium]|nr:ABC transporter permease [Clostridiaceae bacterium]